MRTVFSVLGFNVISCVRSIDLPVPRFRFLRHTILRSESLPFPITLQTLQKAPLPNEAETHPTARMHIDDEDDAKPVDACSSKTVRR
ncbi:hypothetical protein C8F01DRAFT_1169252 [Mycena amicta]|nr:hypothetical protein C8F01DRAFT_1169252 [Mycena amicta]